MKLLLTSNGLCNKSIREEFRNLVGKDAKEISVAFIPTAMNNVDGSKEWFVNDLKNIIDTGVKELDIVDISSLPREVWKKRLSSVDVLFFSGGDASHLLRWIHESGLIELLPEYMKTKVWVGISAGSIVTNPSLAVSNKEKKEEYERVYGFNFENKKALNFVDFYTRIHLDSEHFPSASTENIRKNYSSLNHDLYAYDDETAISVIDGEVKVVTEGNWFKIEA